VADDVDEDVDVDAVAGAVAAAVAVAIADAVVCLAYSVNREEALELQLEVDALMKSFLGCSCVGDGNCDWCCCCCCSCS